MDRSTEIADVLRRARALIEKEENWCQRAYVDGGRYCASGALRAVGSEVGTRAYFALQQAMGADPYCVCEWNDRHTHAEVLTAFDRAIASVSP